MKIQVLIILNQTLGVFVIISERFQLFGGMFTELRSRSLGSTETVQDSFHIWYEYTDLLPNGSLTKCGKSPLLGGHFNGWTV